MTAQRFTLAWLLGQVKDLPRGEMIAEIAKHRPEAPNRQDPLSTEHYHEKGRLLWFLRGQGWPSGITPAEVKQYRDFFAYQVREHGWGEELLAEVEKHAGA